MNEQYKKQREKEMKEMAEKFAAILENEKGRIKVAEIIELGKKLDELSEERNHIAARKTQAEMELLNDFKLTHVEWLNMKIAIQYEGITKILNENKIDRTVV